MYLQMVGRCLRPAEGKTALILDHVGAVKMHGFPDQDHQWTLFGQPKSQRMASDDAPAIRVCETCYAAYTPTLTACPYCGAAATPTAREIEQRAGELAELERVEAKKQAKREQGMARTLEELTELGRVRGYKNPGYWARCVYNSRNKVS